jgi:hypothetical protein
MIIWGSKGKTRNAGSGTFYCPSCRANRQYILKEIGKYFTLYFIPIFRTSKLDDYIECQTCFTPFEKKVLDYDPTASENARKLLLALQSDFEAGMPVQLIYKNMIDNGVSQDSANTIISMATKGKMKACKSCEMIFAATLNYCSICGKILETVE